MDAKLVPATKLLFGAGRAATPVASKIRLSPATGATFPTQFCPVVQLLLTPEPPLQVRVAAAAAVDVAASTTAMPTNSNNVLDADLCGSGARCRDLANRIVRESARADHPLAIRQASRTRAEFSESEATPIGLPLIHGEKRL